MERFRRFVTLSKNALRVGTTLGLVKSLSDIQKNKLLHEFNTFFDVEKTGKLEWRDFDLMRQNISEMSGWKEGTEKFTRTQELFIELWRRLSNGDEEPVEGENEKAVEKEAQNGLENEVQTGTENQEDNQKKADDFQQKPDDSQQNPDDSQQKLNDVQQNTDDSQQNPDDSQQSPEDSQQNPDDVPESPDENQHVIKLKTVTSEDWIKMWEEFHKEDPKKDEEDGHLLLPDWLERYIEYKFNLLDRAGDGFIDVDEFEYVLGNFGISCKDARTCFMLFSSNYQTKIDKECFRELCIEYYKSEDPGALGNFIAGRVDFSEL